MSLATRDLEVTLAGRLVIEGVTASVAPGEILAIAGPNGAGKSTLLKAMAGLLAPAAGAVTLDGVPIASLDRRALGRAVAYLPQERVVHWPVSVRTVVALGRLPHRSPIASESAADLEAIIAAMRAMDVEAFAERSVAALSGGERARVLLARALAQGARFLITDEPTAGLDPAHALALFSILKRLAGHGRGVVVALHDLSFAARFADRMILLKHGRIIAEGRPRDVLTEANLAAAYAVKASLREIDGLPVVVVHAPLT